MFGTHSPKVIRASCSFNSCCSFGSVDLLNRSANSKNLRLSSSFACSPISTSSTSIRFALTFRFFAKAFTRLASGEGRETLWRTAFSIVPIKQLYTILHQNAPFTFCKKFGKKRPDQTLSERSNSGNYILKTNTHRTTQKHHSLISIQFPFKQIPCEKVRVFIPNSMKRAANFAGSWMRGEIHVSWRNVVIRIKL